MKTKTKSRKKTVKCKHTKLIPCVYQQLTHTRDYEDVTYKDVTYWEQGSAFEDYDLHRMKCSVCGEFDYYSEAARKFYTKGIKSNIRGLNY